MSQQVIDYLAKKGYTRTEAMLRMESASQEIDGRSLPQSNENQRPKYQAGFGMLVYSHSPKSAANKKLADLLKVWIEDNLDLYKVTTLPHLLYAVLTGS